MGDPSPDARLGAVIAGKYELVRVLGAGGAGAVYEARHRTTGGRYALKLLHAREGRDGEARLLREARALAKLSHPHIVRLVDFDACPEGVFLVEDLLEGRTLRALLDEELVLSPSRATALLLPVLRALGHAHARGVVHRDVKPENIVLCAGDDGSVTARLVDFGLALDPTDAPGLTRHGTLLGTPRYMSPEQAWGREDVDARSDLWSFGVVLYECLSGLPPYAGDNDRAVLAAIVASDPPHLRTAGVAVDDALADAVMLALVRAPEARCPSAAALERALLGEASEPVAEAPRSIAPAPIVRTYGRVTALAGTLLAGALLALALGARGTASPQRAAAPPPRALRTTVPSSDGGAPHALTHAPLPATIVAVAPDAGEPPRHRPRPARPAAVSHGTNHAPIVDDL
jgi:serine/threonine protein kinase